MQIFAKKSFWLATIMTLICSVAGVLLAKLPYWCISYRPLIRDCNAVNPRGATE